MTFAEAECAYEVIDKFSKDPMISNFDIRFGGRRKFCKQNYADLGNDSTLLSKKVSDRMKYFQIRFKTKSTPTLRSQPRTCRSRIC